jgi:hypothetical protein
VIAGTVVPANPVVFTCSNTAAVIKGRLFEYSTGAGTVQYFDASGTAGAQASATSLPVTAAAANTYTGGLAVVDYAANWSAAGSGQSWATPAGWTSDGTVNNLALTFSTYYQAGTGAGPVSATGTISPGSGGTMTAWAAGIATYYALAATPVSITTTSLPNGTSGAAYSAAVAVSGGAPAYAWAVTNGSLPGGLSLDPATGAITGTPTAAGTFSFTVTVTDSATQTATAAFTVVIADALTITTTSPLPAGTLGQPYTAQLDVAGGTGPYAWAITAGALPPGLAIIPLPSGPIGVPAGTITGAPLLAGTFTFTARVTDLRGATATAALAITVPAAAPLTILTKDLPPGKLGQPYAAAFTATGGVQPYHWSLTTGALPPGLTLNDDGTVTGTLLAAGAYHFTVTVTD